MKNIIIYLFDGFSDWEISYLTPEINKDKRFKLCFVSDDGKPINSMGGLTIQPTHSLADIHLEDIEMLILPGGTAWENSEMTEITNYIRQCSKKNICIAAICAATIHLGKMGLLDNVQHTSNDLNYLKAMAPNYTGEKLYQKSLAATGDNIITASGIAPIEFAKEIFNKIELFPKAQTEAWYNLFKHGIWTE